MCDYCEKGKSINFYNDCMNNIVSYVECGDLVVESNYIGSRQRILYCPMCGKKLKHLEDI